MPWTTLHAAACDGDVSALSIALKQKGCDLEAREDGNGGTAFMLAVSVGATECMVMLAEAGCDTAPKSNNGKTTLMVASHANEVVALQMALEKGWGDIEARDDDHNATAFLVACKRGTVVCMELLADAGCNTNCQTIEGKTPLICCAGSGEPEAVRLAVEKRWGALDARRRDTAEYGATAFLTACNKGCVESMQMLADAGSDTMTTTGNGKTALICTVCSGVPEAVQMALENHWSDLEAQDYQGATAFLLSCAKASVGVGKIPAGATSQTRVEWAAANHDVDKISADCVECIKLLADAGSDINAKPKDGQSGLDMARRQGHDALVELLQSMNEERKTAALKRQAKGLMKAKRYQEAADVYRKSLRLTPGCAETEAALEKAEKGAKAALAKGAARAEKAEAELLAMLDAEEAVKAAKPGGGKKTAAEAKAAAEKKRKKRARQQAKKRAGNASPPADPGPPAAAAAAAAGAEEDTNLQELQRQQQMRMDQLYVPPAAILQF